MIQPFKDKLVITPDITETVTTKSGLILGDQQTHLIWGTIDTIGEEVRSLVPGESVLFNVLLAREVGDQYVVPETACYLTR